MTIGEKIKYIRTFRGITQQQLGVAIELSAKGADNRMAQYDYNDDMPSVPPVGMWFHYSTVNDFMHEWMVHKQELAEGQIIQAEYLEWKLNWPDTCCERGPAHEPCEPKYQWKKSDSETES